MAGVAAALTLSSCGGEAASDPEAGGPSARLVVQQRLGETDVIPTEGSFGFVELQQGGNQPVASGNLPTTRRSTLVDEEVPAGDYTLVAYQRLCNANCGNLGDPTARCEAPVTLEPGRTLRAVVEVTYTEPCSITVR